MKLLVGRATIQLVKGDITEQTTDAIVNAANPSLMGGGGVDGSIHRKGGPKILEECKKIRSSAWRDGLPIGLAVVTTGGNLRARHVIHTVGPVWKGGDKGEPKLLSEAYRNCLSLAVSLGLGTVAFPSISTGVYGYPIGKASRVALVTAKEFLQKQRKLRTVIFVLFTHADLKVYEKTATEIFRI